MSAILADLLAGPSPDSDKARARPSEKDDPAGLVDYLAGQFLQQPDNLLPLVQLAELLNRQDSPDAAERLADFVVATSKKPNEVRSGLIAKFNIARRRKNKDEIIAAADAIKAVDPTYVSAYHDVVTLHIDERNFALARHELDAARAHNVEHTALTLDDSRVDYFEAFHYEKVSALRKTLLPGTDLLDSAGIEAEIVSAIENERPYHFLRLGDGEGVAIGAMLFDDAFTVARNHNLARNLNIWFGPSKPAIELFIDRLQAPLLKAILNADLVGIPDIPPLRKTWKSEERGYFGYVNVIRLIDRIKRESPDIFRRMKFTGCHANVGLQTRNSIHNILKKVDRCAIFTCHPQLEGVLKERFGLKEVTVYRTPSRAASANLFKSDLTAPHFPDVYYQILREIETMPRGTLCLNAAGFLGKMYADAAKDRGGIIVDIGSVADFWLGYRSRQFTEGLSEADWRAQYTL
ncbi:hypothetical protein ASG52_05885 [Methylobacterium sp. Leaf456]|uniref:tetratricopeptide repeat protein n=1 Tax=Methylobacterium sp. Leaf456 TaxID=1736382 RepID=UPI000700934F|nr:hypothetical protein [Methylobacterium sp. Leaf456]KQT50353.1 hypothetical protein ASG52_05885 [Methylobacterium sp. Leaf456]